MESIFVQLRFSSYLRIEAIKDQFFEISTKLSESKAVRVAKNIKMHYDFIMHNDWKHFHSYNVSNVTENHQGPLFWNLVPKKAQLYLIIGKVVVRMCCVQPHTLDITTPHSLHTLAHPFKTLCAQPYTVQVCYSQPHKYSEMDNKIWNGPLLSPKARNLISF